MNDDTTRLNKYLALQLGISRREADTLIERGKVKLDGKTATLGARLTPQTKVEIDDKTIKNDEEHLCIALHKPVAYVCSRRQQGDSPTVYSLLPKKLHKLKLVGRLDRDSSGLILLTNDGDFAYRMTHPKFYKTKIYEVELDQPLVPLHQQIISDYGVDLDDGKSKFELERLSDTDRKRWKIHMSEGRNRQIRRTFSALGYTVTALHRTNFGSYALNELPPGSYTTVKINS